MSGNKNWVIKLDLSALSSFINGLSIFWVRLFVVITIVSLPAVSIWYSGWFADAQQEMLSQIINENLKNKIEAKVAKPNFFDVSKKHLFDLDAPPLWTILSIIGFSITQMLQSWIKEENKILLDKNKSLSESILSKDKEISGLQNILNNVRDECRKKLDKEVEEHDITRKHYMHSVKQELNNFFKVQGWFDKNSCRLSLYRFYHNKEGKSMAYLMHRFCNITEYECVNRIAIPAYEGFISAVLNNGERIFCEIEKFDPADENKYYTQIRHKLNSFRSLIDDETFSMIRMKSCVYYCRAIRERGLIGNDKFAVFVIESQESSAFNEKALDRIFENSSEDIYRIVNHLYRLDSITNPVKEGV